MAYPSSTPQQQRYSRHRQGIYINGTILGERRTALHLLEEQRNAILHHLQTLIGKKQGEREQEAERRGVVQSLCSNGRMAERAAASLQKGKQQLEQKRAELSQRRATLDALFEQLKKERLRSTTYLFPNDLRTHEMALLHTRLGLAADQRLKLRQLLDVLPLTVTGMGKSYAPNALGVGSAAGGYGHGGVAIAICGLRLPEKLALDTLQQEPAQQVALSASLGYMLLLSELLAAYIGGPVLHEGSFQGSTTVLWQQQSFWDRRPSSSNEVLPLFVEKGLSVLGAALGAATGSTAETQTVKSSSSGWGPLSLLRRVSSNPSPPMPPSSTSPPQKHTSSLLHSSSPQQQQQWQQQWQWHQWPYRPPQGMEAEVQAHAQARHANLDLAFNMLQRSASSLVHDKACDLGLTLPASWGPFGWLVMLCAALVQDDDCPHSRLGGVLSAAAGCVQSERHFAQQQRAKQEHAALHYHVHKQRQQQQQQQRALQHHHQASKPQSPSSQQLQQQQRTSAPGSTSHAAAPSAPHAPRTNPAFLRPTEATDACSRGGDGVSEGACAIGTGGASTHVLEGAGSIHLVPPGPPLTVQHPHNGLDGTKKAVGGAMPGGQVTGAAAAAHPASSGQQPLTEGHSTHHAPQGWGVSSVGAQGMSSVAEVANSSLQGPPLVHPRHEVGGPAGGVQAHLRVANNQQHHQHGMGPEEEEEGGWEEVGHQHILPPPPSAEEDVLQYVRALYGDGNTDRPPS
uniref:Uncharacterized protein n=1 Tax=Dunaliella tertiolecta TaxID=3047 RepID=A0A7S3QPL1_DUNTE|mmetsp:Transcript_10352/g.28276  ORF Transcript_10352/g.28276 Transcript_10352/m.28276 type:complete len:739 (+) Transcript_10352:48-2264(+)